jgi:Mg2+ and Co2+ transporter CorA
MGNARQDNIKYRQWLWPKRDILLNVVQREYVTSFRRELTVAYFRDVYDHVVMMIQKLQIMNEVLTSLEETYLAKISIEMAKTSNEVNDVMKKLTLFASIIVPMTFISGVFGMNISIPWQTPGDDTGSLSAFVGIVVFMVVFAILSVAIFKYNKYI